MTTLCERCGEDPFEERCEYCTELECDFCLAECETIAEAEMDEEIK